MSFKENFTTLVGMSCSFYYEDQFLPHINKMMEEGRSKIGILNSFIFNHFDLVRLENGNYQIEAFIRDEYVKDLHGEEIKEFTRDHYLKYYRAVEKHVGVVSKEKLESAIWDELNHDKAEFKFKKNWRRKVLGCEISTVGRLTWWFDIRLVPDDQTFHNGTKVIWSMNEAGMIDRWGEGNVIASYMKDNWYLPEQSIVLQNTKLSERNESYYKQVLSRVLAKELMKRLKSQVLQ